MWLAKQVTTNRRSGRARNTLRSVSPTVDSEAVKPGSSALVESDSSRRMPSLRGQGAHPGQVGPSAVHRVEVELEVTRVEDHALGRVEGGGEGVRDRVGDRDELDVTGTDPPAVAVGDRR